MPLTKLREFLDSHDIKYMVVSHSIAYTAQGVAALVHLSGKKLAKTVIVKVDDDLAMAVVPASFHVDLDLVRNAASARTVEVATEQEFKDAFPDCETGAMPPFGNLYGMAVFVDPGLGDADEITFTAGTHRELVRMAWSDLVQLVNPKVVNLTHRAVAVA
jgi:Ala-tRNA(Pro) deacylase